MSVTKSKKPAQTDPLADLKSDFRNFLYVVWLHLNLPAPTEMQYDIAQSLQDGPKRFVVEALRGIGKSWITSAYVCWLLLRDPQLKILVVSASKQRADDFTTFTRRLISDMEILRHLEPKEGQRDSKVSFDVGPARPDHAPSVKSVGITGQLSGSRADVIIPDDVEVPNNSQTEMMREKLSEAVKEFDAVLKTNPDARVLYLGTPQCEMSLYNRLPDRGYTVRIWPARYPKNAKQRQMYGDRLAPFLAERFDKDPSLAWQPTDSRFTERDLLEREASYGRSGFALQFMLDTSLSDAERYPLKLGDLIVYPLDLKVAPAQLAWGNSPDLIINDLHNVGFAGDRFYRPSWIARDDAKQNVFAPYAGILMAIDPSGRGKDETAYAVVAALHGFLFLLASGGYTDGYSTDTLEHLAGIAKKYAVKQIIVEPNFGDGMFTQIFKPVLGRVYPCSIEESERSQAQKERRIIDTLEPVMNQHRLVVAADVIKKDFESTQNMPVEDSLRYQLFYQMTRITKERGALVRDDRLDALALAVHHWLESMGRDTNKALKDHQNRLLDAELKRFMEHATGRKAGNSSWLNHFSRR